MEFIVGYSDDSFLRADYYSKKDKILVISEKLLVKEVCQETSSDKLEYSTDSVNGDEDDDLNESIKSNSSVGSISIDSVKSLAFSPRYSTTTPVVDTEKETTSPEHFKKNHADDDDIFDIDGEDEDDDDNVVKSDHGNDFALLQEWLIEGEIDSLVSNYSIQFDRKYKQHNDEVQYRGHPHVHINFMPYKHYEHVMGPELQKMVSILP